MRVIPQRTCPLCGKPPRDHVVIRRTLDQALASDRRGGPPETVRVPTRELLALINRLDALGCGQPPHTPE